jgi:hypothetical protein
MPADLSYLPQRKFDLSTFSHSRLESEIGEERENLFHIFRHFYRIIILITPLTTDVKSEKRKLIQLRGNLLI